MISDLDAIQLPATGPVGPDRAADPSLLSIGTVQAIDPVAHTVTVALRGDTSALVVLVASPARYRLGGSCYVLHNPLDGGRAVHVLDAVDPLPPAVLGVLKTAGVAPAYTATVTVFGKDYPVQYSAATYTVTSRVWVELDSWGVPFRMDGSSPEPAPTAPPVVTDPGGGASTVQVTTTIGPQWSGTWRANRGAYDRYNADRPQYGGRSTLYQGSIGSSSQLTGLAVFGDLFVNLGATSIDRVQVTARPVGASGAGGNVTIQGTPQGSPYPGAPAPGGEAAVGLGLVDLAASTREDLRTGAVRGLAVVGGNYQAVAGAGNGDGMVAIVTYTRPA